MGRRRKRAQPKASTALKRLHRRAHSVPVRVTRTRSVFVETNDDGEAVWRDEEYEITVPRRADEPATSLKAYARALACGSGADADVARAWLRNKGLGLRRRGGKAVA